MERQLLEQQGLSSTAYLLDCCDFSYFLIPEEKYYGYLFKRIVVLNSGC